jgi:hypothetical protein
MAKNKIYIPTFISSIDYKPARVLPHVYFYNGTKSSDGYYIESINNSGSIQFHPIERFPYFDNYEGSTPTTGSRSLLFNNETAPYGDLPTGSLYSEYWSTYVDLLYNPRTRIFDCSAIIPLADYFKMNLNDIVEWRGNYYHLRAINDYNLKNGECSLQLLGPVLPDVISNVLPSSCNFDFDISNGPTPTSSLWDLTKCDNSTTFYGVTFDTTSSLSAGQVVQFGTPALLDGCYTLATSSASPDLTGSIIFGIFDNCTDCSGSTPPVYTGYELADCAGAATSSVYVSFSGAVPSGSFVSSTLGNGCWFVVGETTHSLDYTSITPDYTYVDCDTCLYPSSCRTFINNTDTYVIADYYDCQLGMWVFGDTIYPNESRCIGARTLTIISGGTLDPGSLCNP